MKGKRFLICVLVIPVLLVVICFAFPQLPLRVYPGDRIKGTVQLTIDGETITLREDSFLRVNDDVKVRIRENKAARISMQAGEYGSYGVNLVDDHLDRSVSINCFQHDWWNVMRFHLEITVDTKTQQITYFGHCITFGDNGRRINEPISQTQPITDGFYQIHFGL